MLLSPMRSDYNHSFEYFAKILNIKKTSFLTERVQFSFSENLPLQQTQILCFCNRSQPQSET